MASVASDGPVSNSGSNDALAAARAAASAAASRTSASGGSLKNPHAVARGKRVGATPINVMATIYTRFFSISDDPLKKYPRKEQLLADVLDRENETLEQKAVRVGNMTCDKFFEDGCDPELKTPARGTTDVGKAEAVAKRLGVFTKVDLGGVVTEKLKDSSNYRKVDDVIKELEADDTVTLATKEVERMRKLHGIAQKVPMIKMMDYDGSCEKAAVLEMTSDLAGRLSLRKGGTGTKELDEFLAIAETHTATFSDNDSCTIKEFLEGDQALKYWWGGANRDKLGAAVLALKADLIGRGADPTIFERKKERVQQQVRSSNKRNNPDHCRREYVDDQGDQDTDDHRHRHRHRHRRRRICEPRERSHADRRLASRHDLRAELRAVLRAERRVMLAELKRLIARKEEHVVDLTGSDGGGSDGGGGGGGGGNSALKQLLEQQQLLQTLKLDKQEADEKRQQAEEDKHDEGLYSARYMDLQQSAIDRLSRLAASAGADAAAIASAAKVLQ